MTGFVASNGGGTFLFPMDQLMVVRTDGEYMPLRNDDAHNLSWLTVNKKYLVWYHHLLKKNDWKKKRDGHLAKLKSSSACIVIDPRCTNGCNHLHTLLWVTLTELS